MLFKILRKINGISKRRKYLNYKLTFILFLPAA